MSSEYCLLVEASSCLEAAEKPQWPRVYSLGRPRSRSRMPSLVGDSGQVLGVTGLGFNWNTQFTVCAAML